MGSHLLELLGELRMPVVTTLHAILAQPSPLRRDVMDRLTRVSERLVTMTTHGASVLREVHQVPESKIDVVPHGITPSGFAAAG